MKRYILSFLILLGVASAMAQPKLSDLVVTPTFGGGTIKWFDASAGGTQYTTPATTNLVDGQTYYASQTLNGAESTDRLVVNVTIKATTIAPVVSPNVIPPGVTEVRGTSSEANGTAIEVFVNSISKGTTTLSNHNWSKSVDVLANGDEVKATATAIGKCQSILSNIVTVAPLF